MSQSQEQPLRRELQTLPLLPWDTNAIMSNIVPEGFEAQLQALQSALVQRERILLSNLQYDPNDAKLNVPVLRQFFIPAAEKSFLNLPISSLHFSQFMQQLCIYRIFDVAHRLVPNPGSKPLHERQLFTIKRTFYKHMNDLTKLVETQVRCLNWSSDPRPRIKSASDSPELRSWNMLSDISSLADTHQVTAAESNFLVAAFCLRFYLEGHLDLPEDKVDLYQSLSQAINKTVPPHWPKGTTQQMRLPLQLALTISPLCLLIPVQLSKLDVNREDLVVAWQCLGNMRPPIIKEAEDLLWKLLFNVATRQAELKNEMPYAVHRIAPLFKNATLEERAWFKQNKGLEKNHSFISRPFKLLSCPEGWPMRDMLLQLGGRPCILGFLEDKSSRDLIDRSLDNKKSDLPQGPNPDNKESDSPAGPNLNRDESHSPVDQEDTSHENQGNRRETPENNSEKDPIPEESDVQPSTNTHLNGPQSPIDQADPVDENEENTRATPESDLLQGGNAYNKPSPKNQDITANNEGDDEDGEQRNNEGRELTLAQPFGMVKRSYNLRHAPPTSLRAGLESDFHNVRSTSTSTPKRKRQQRSDSESDSHLVHSIPNLKQKQRAESDPPLNVLSTPKRKRLTRQEVKGNLEDEDILKDVLVIDLTNEWHLPHHTLNLAGSNSQPYPLAKEHVMFAMRGTTERYKSPLPLVEDQNFLNDIVNAVQSGYQDGAPPHWSGKGSVFHFVTHNVFQSMAPGKVQAIFRKQHIVVTEIPQKNTLAFDRKGLETLGSWKGLRTLHDLTIPRPFGDYSVRNFQGTLEDLWKHASSDDGRVLNALDFPLPDAEGPDHRLASDIKAWKDTFQVPMCNKELEYPIHELRRGLAATRGAQRLWHIDAEGVGTTIEVKTGRKWWFVAKPKEDGKGFVDLRHQLDWMYDPAAKNDQLWDSEAILLLPGMKLIMRPDTPHADITPEHAICHGNHFISTATLRQTCFGVIHSFVLRHVVSNSENRAVWYNLQRLLLYYRELYYVGYLHDPELDTTHLPDCTSIDGVLDLFTFLVTMELGLALFPGSYDENGIGLQDWIRLNQAKQAALDILNWFLHHFEIRSCDQKPDHIYPVLLLQTAIMLVDYKEKSVKDRYGKKEAPPRQSTSAVLYEVLEVITSHPEIKPVINHRLELLNDSFNLKTDLCYAPFTVNRKIGTDPGWNRDCLDAKPNLDLARYRYIKDQIISGSWPKPKVTVDQFLGKAELSHFPFKGE